MRHEPITLDDATQKYLYQGKEKQPEWKVYDFGARFYDAALGRWGTSDPMASGFAGESPYSGMGNNPVSMVDPDGRSYGMGNQWQGYPYYPEDLEDRYGRSHDIAGSHLGYPYSPLRDRSSVPYGTNRYHYLVHGISPPHSSYDTGDQNWGVYNGYSWYEASDFNTWMAATSPSSAQRGLHQMAIEDKTRRIRDKLARTYGDAYADNALDYLAGRGTIDGSVYSFKTRFVGYGSEVNNALQVDPEGNLAVYLIMMEYSLSSLDGGSLIVDNTLQGLGHYYFGDGSSVRIGPRTTASLLSSEQFLNAHRSIVSGERISQDQYTIDMKNHVFHIGETRVSYSINTGNNGVTYRLYEEDGFWDVDRWDEDVFGDHSPYFSPDKMGPNLERGGKPYRYEPTVIIFPLLETWPLTH